MVGEEIVGMNSRVRLYERREGREVQEGRKGAGRNEGRLLTTWSVAVRAINKRQIINLPCFIVLTYHH